MSQTKETFESIDTSDFTQHIDRINADYWAAFGHTIGKSRFINRPGVRLIAALRFASATYLDRPSFDIDTLQLNQNNNLYLGSAGISFRKYYKDQ